VEQADDDVVSGWAMYEVNGELEALGCTAKNTGRKRQRESLQESLAWT